MAKDDNFGTTLKKLWNSKYITTDDYQRLSALSEQAAIDDIKKTGTQPGSTEQAGPTTAPAAKPAQEKVTPEPAKPTSATNSVPKTAKPAGEISPQAQLQQMMSQYNALGEKIQKALAGVKTAEETSVSQMPANVTNTTPAPQESQQSLYDSIMAQTKELEKANQGFSERLKTQEQQVSKIIDLLESPNIGIAGRSPTGNQKTADEVAHKQFMAKHGTYVD